MAEPAPVLPRERIQYWDVLRGIAVLGVLMANMPLMSLTRSLNFQQIDLSHGAGDTFAFWFVRVFADTKFITIFSTLFGAGLALMSEKSIARGTAFTGVYIRRLVALGVIGVLHAWYVWFGDILFHYALMGFVAMWFRKLSPKALLWIGASLILLLGALNTLLGFADPADFVEVPEGKTVEEVAAAKDERIHDRFSSGSFQEATAERKEQWGAVVFFFTLFWGGRTLGLFLVGMALVRSRILLDIAASRELAKRAIAIGLPVGALLTVAVVVTTNGEGTGARVVQSGAFYFLALFMSPAYMGLVALWTLSDRARWLQERFAAAGRMAFTNYLSHSVITCAIFCFGRQWDRWDRLAGLGLTFAIYVLQLWFSPWWLARFRFGPMEWLWRSVTYWKLQPMRRDAG